MSTSTMSGPLVVADRAKPKQRRMEFYRRRCLYEEPLSCSTDIAAVTSLYGSESLLRSFILLPSAHLNKLHDRRHRLVARLSTILAHNVVDGTQRPRRIRTQRHHRKLSTISEDADDEDDESSVSSQRSQEFAEIVMPPQEDNR